MNLGRLNHVGVATPSIEQSLELYGKMFNAKPHGPAFDLPRKGSACVSSILRTRRSN